MRVLGLWSRNRKPKEPQIFVGIGIHPGNLDDPDLEEREFAEKSISELKRKGFKRFVIQRDVGKVPYFDFIALAAEGPKIKVERSSPMGARIQRRLRGICTSLLPGAGRKLDIMVHSSSRSIARKTFKEPKTVVVASLNHIHDISGLVPAGASFTVIKSPASEAFLKSPNADIALAAPKKTYMRNRIKKVRERVKKREAMMRRRLRRV